MAWSSNLAVEVRALFEEAQRPVDTVSRIHLEMVRAHVRAMGRIYNQEYRRRMKAHPLKWEKELARARRNYRKLRRDPTRYAEYLAYCRTHYHKKYKQASNDPEAYEVYKQKKRVADRAKRKRLRRNPEKLAAYHAADREQHRLKHQKLQADPLRHAQYLEARRRRRKERQASLTIANMSI
jgi:hypothetical protein